MCDCVKDPETLSNKENHGQYSRSALQVDPYQRQFIGKELLQLIENGATCLPVHISMHEHVYQTLPSFFHELQMESWTGNGWDGFRSAWRGCISLRALNYLAGYIGPDSNIARIWLKI